MSEEVQVEESVEAPMDDVPVSEPETTEQAYDDVSSPEPAPAQQEEFTPPQAQSDYDVQAELAEIRRQKAEAEAKAHAYESIYSQHTSVQDRQYQEQQERERLLNMTAEERLVYAAEQQEKRLEQTVLDAERRIREANDRASFAALKANEPAAAKMEKEIEAMVEAERAKGINLDREVAYTWLLGQKAREASKGAGSKKAQQVRQHNTNVSQTRATAGAGDQSGSREAEVDEKSALYERLAAGKTSSHYR